MEQMGLDQEEAVQGSQAAVRQAETVEQVTEEARWRDLLAQWRGQTVAVLTLPDLSALVVCWDQGNRRRCFGRRPCLRTVLFCGNSSARRLLSWATI